VQAADERRKMADERKAALSATRVGAGAGAGAGATGNGCVPCVAGGGEGGGTKFPLGSIGNPASSA